MLFAMELSLCFRECDIDFQVMRDEKTISEETKHSTEETLQRLERLHNFLSTSSITDEDARELFNNLLPSFFFSVTNIEKPSSEVDDFLLNLGLAILHPSIESVLDLSTWHRVCGACFDLALLSLERQDPNSHDDSKTANNHDNGTSAVSGAFKLTTAVNILDVLTNGHRRDGIEGRGQSAFWTGKFRSNLLPQYFQDEIPSLTDFKWKYPPVPAAGLPEDSIPPVWVIAEPQPQDRWPCLATVQMDDIWMDRFLRLGMPERLLILSSSKFRALQLKKNYNLETKKGDESGRIFTETASRAFYNLLKSVREILLLIERVGHRSTTLIPLSLLSPIAHLLNDTLVVFEDLMEMLSLCIRRSFKHLPNLVVQVLETCLIILGMNSSAPINNIRLLLIHRVFAILLKTQCIDSSTLRGNKQIISTSTANFLSQTRLSHKLLEAFGLSCLTDFVQSNVDDNGPARPPLIIPTWLFQLLAPNASIPHSAPNAFSAKFIPFGVSSPPLEIGRLEWLSFLLGDRITGNLLLDHLLLYPGQLLFCLEP